MKKKVLTTLAVGAATMAAGINANVHVDNVTSSKANHSETQLAASKATTISQMSQVQRAFSQQ